MEDITTTQTPLPFGIPDGDKVNYLVKIKDGNDTNYADYSKSSDSA